MFRIKLCFGNRCIAVHVIDCLNFLKGVIQDSLTEVIKGDTWSLDYSSCGGLRVGFGAYLDLSKPTFV